MLKSQICVRKASAKCIDMNAIITALDTIYTANMKLGSFDRFILFFIIINIIIFLTIIIRLSLNSSIDPFIYFSSV